MNDHDIEAYVDASAALLGLPIAPEQRAGVLHYLRLAAAMAPRVMDFDLTREDEAATVFQPVEPGIGVPDEATR